MIYSNEFQTATDLTKLELTFEYNNNTRTFVYLFIYFLISLKVN